MTPRRARRNPHLYEISAWPWLERLSQAAGRPLTLADVPPAEWDRIAAGGFDFLYLMGVWRRSRIGRRIARTDLSLFAGYDRALPGWSMRDVPGSPYSIQAYEPDDRMGGWDALDAARAALAARGVGLVLDFVANHTGFDHEWIRTRPELYVQGTLDDYRRAPDRFHPIDDATALTLFACGRDPWLPVWSDVAQLNYFNPATRQAMQDALDGIARHCDGVRCDMAMLVLNDVFRTTWSGVDLLWADPATEFWPEAISRTAPLLFLAEVYWDRGYQLQQQGFHYTYDKRLLDRLRDGDGAAVHGHLQADPAYSARLARFLENHDEPRSAALFESRVPAAAAIAYGVPGMRFFFDGQFEGARVQTPVQLARWAGDDTDTAIRDFYRRLLELIDGPLTHDGEWSLLDVHPAGDNEAALVASAWRLEDARAVIVANVSDTPAQGLVQVPDLAGAGVWSFEDRATGEVYRRTAADLAQGLFVRLAGGRAHLFVVTQEGTPL